MKEKKCENCARFYSCWFPTRIPFEGYNVSLVQDCIENGHKLYVERDDDSEQKKLNFLIIISIVLSMGLLFFLLFAFLN